MWFVEGLMVRWVSWGCLFKTGDWGKGREGYEEGNGVVFVIYFVVG